MAPKPPPPPVAAAQLLSEVQGDILAGGIPKKNESFIFFHIEDSKEFCHKLYIAMNMGLFSSGMFTATRRSYLTSGKKDENGKGGEKDAPEHAVVPGLPKQLLMAIGQISFTAPGLAKLQEALPEGSLGITKAWAERDEAFFRGMEADATDTDTGLKDNMEQWEGAYKGQKIHGMFLVAGTGTAVKEFAKAIVLTFGPAALSIVHTESGQVREGDKKGYEHFGFNDGVSQPTVEGFPEDRRKVPDREVGELGKKWNTFPQSTFVVQDADGSDRPKWTKHGSFLVFRKLEQDVKKWNEDIDADAKRRNVSPSQLASKIVGRWQSGCPMMVNSSKDDKTQAFNNQFDFNNIPRHNDGDAICPGGAHIRQMNPHRAVKDKKLGIARREGRILRRAIPYGTDYNDGKGEGTRGLHFVCYQSSIEEGFREIQIYWANPDEFPVSGAGVDVFMGNQLADGTSRAWVADDDGRKNHSSFEFKGLNPYVKARGGEYFFVPSFTALTETLAIKTEVPSLVL